MILSPICTADHQLHHHPRSAHLSTAAGAAAATAAAPNQARRSSRFQIKDVPMFQTKRNHPRGSSSSNQESGREASPSHAALDWREMLARARASQEAEASVQGGPAMVTDTFR